MDKEYINIGTIKDDRFIETESLIKLLESDLDMFNKEKENIKKEECFNKKMMYIMVYLEQYLI